MTDKDILNKALRLKLETMLDDFANEHGTSHDDIIDILFTSMNWVVHYGLNKTGSSPFALTDCFDKALNDATIEYLKKMPAFQELVAKLGDLSQIKSIGDLQKKFATLGITVNPDGSVNKAPKADSPLAGKGPTSPDPLAPVEEKPDNVIAFPKAKFVKPAGESN